MEKNSFYFELPLYSRDSPGILMELQGQTEYRGPSPAASPNLLVDNRYAMNDNLSRDNDGKEDGNCSVITESDGMTGEFQDHSCLMVIYYYSILFQ